MADDPQQEANNGTLSPVINLTGGMAPGEWIRFSVQIPLVDYATHSALAEQYNAPWNAWGNTGSQAVIAAWNSAAYDNLNNRLFIMGGGHADYGGNEVYQLDFDTLAWSRLTDPSPLVVAETDVSDGSPVYLPLDGPPAPHTYDGLTWNPVSQSLWLTTHSSFNFGVPHNPETTAAWEFDPATLTWTQHATTTNQAHPTSTFIEETGQVLSIEGTHNTSTAARLIDADGTVHELGDVQGAPNSQIANMFTNPVTGDIYEAHSGGIYQISLTEEGVSSVKVSDYPTDWSFGFLQAGFAYYPADGKFYAWNGGERVASWDPATDSYELLWNELSADAPTDQDLGVGKVFDKWVYLEEADAFAGIQGSGEVWFYRPGPNPGNIDQAAIGDVTTDAATAHTLNFYLPLVSGDRDYDSNVQVFYRESGTQDWQQSLDLMRLRPELVTSSRGIAETGEGFAGSLFDLDPGQTYEVRFEISDPDGLSGPSSQVITATTSGLPVTDPQSANTTVVTDMASLQAAVDQAAAGDVIVIGPGHYVGHLNISASGTAENPIVLRGVDRSSTILDGDGNATVIRITGDNVHIEDLTLRNAGTGITLRGDTDGVSIQSNHIKEVSKGIDALDGHTNLYIVDNVLEGPVAYADTSSATWNNEGIVVTGQGIEVAHNTLSGFGDSLGLHHSSGGLANIGIDIHHNLVQWGGDDGIEFDFALRNVQAHHNLIANSANGISFQPVWGGPAYAFENVLYNTERGPYKINPEIDSPSGIYILNNTSIRAGEAWENFSGSPSNLFVLNNLFVNQGEQVYTLVNQSNNRLVEMDFNAWTTDGRFQLAISGTDIVDVGTDFEQWQNATPFDNNGQLLSGQQVFENLLLDFDLNGFDVYRDPATGDFNLASGSTAIDAGLVLHGINDDFTGLAPDIGAWELGAEAPVYGARFSLQTSNTPFAIADHAYNEIDSTITINVLSNDFEPQGAPLSIVGLSNIVNGSASLNGDDTVSFTPNAGFLGTAGFDYTVTNPEGNQATASVVVSVTAPNIVPTAGDDSFALVGNSTLLIPELELLANDADLDGELLTLSTVTGADHGTVLLGTGGIEYTPTAGFYGSDSFQYSITDERGGTASASVTVSVHPDGTVLGTPGNDTIDLGGLAGTTATGESAAATLTGYTVLAGAGNDVVIGSQSNDIISGGAGTDRLSGGAGDDVFLVAGMQDGEDVIDGGAGFDVLRGSSGDDLFGIVSPITGIERIEGGGGNDIIRGTAARDALDFSDIELLGIAAIEGGEGHDYITGSSGNDLIVGGAGTDFLRGGDGDDSFLVNGSADGFDDVDGGAGVDTWLGTEGDDVFGVWARFEGLERIEGNGGYDVVRGHAGRDFMDFSAMSLSGVAAIEGAGGADIITGSAGDDVIVGGADTDYLTGGAGNDIFMVNGSGDGFDAISGGAGIDTWLGSAGDDVFGVWSTFDTLEAITGNGGYDIVQGSTGSDTLDFSATTLMGIAAIDGGNGHDIITGSQGDDVFLENLGVDRIDGNAGDDTVQYAGSFDSYALRFDNADALILSSLDIVGDIDTLTNIETVSFDDGYYDVQARNFVPNNVAPLAVADAVSVQVGSSVVVNLLNNDSDENGDTFVLHSIGTTVHGTVTILTGGQVSYTPDAGFAGLDSFSYSIIDSGGLVSETASVSLLVVRETLEGTATRDRFDLSDSSGPFTINGYAGSDIITGSMGNDKITGGADIDFLQGGSGDDIFVVNGTNDSLDNVDGGDGFDTWLGSAGDDVFGVWARFSNLEQIDGNGGYDVVRGHYGRDFMDFSNMTLTGVAAIEGAGGSDIITGSDGDDVIVGGADIDYLSGGAGNDTFVVIGSGDGYDSVNGGAGVDTWLGSAGDDVFGIWANFNSIEVIDGNGGNDTVLGHYGSDTLDFSQVQLNGIALIDGGAGHDIITGSAGNDTITGGVSGADKLYGGNGDDQLFYDYYDSILDGGEGDDTLILGPAGSIDLSRLSLRNLENLEMSNGAGGDQATISLADVLDLSDTLDFHINGDVGDTVHIRGAAVEVGSESNNGVSYTVYSPAEGNARLLLDQDLSVDFII